MTNTVNKTNWLPLILVVLLLVSFFLPWVSWNGLLISGYHLPAGRFFAVAETHFGLGNPFPQFNFSFWVFWLIPVLAIWCFILAALKRSFTWPALITAVLTLSLTTVFYLFSGVLVDLGVGSSALSMLQPFIYTAAIAAAAIILTVLPRNAWLKKPVWILAGPLLALTGFTIVKGYISDQKFDDTASVKADYTVKADDLLHEFTVNDSSANAKYREKIMIVNGIASKVEMLEDSTINLQFADSSGSYAIFSFDKDQFEKVKTLKAGDAVSVKGSCSGSIYSSILGTTSISFKRSTLNKKNQ